MTIYSLYIFDRHCACVYYQDWHRLTRLKPAVGGDLLPAVTRDIPSQASTGDARNSSVLTSPRNTLTSQSGTLVAVGDLSLQQGPSRSQTPTVQASQPQAGLPFDEEAKLVYGVILSLRNMIRKLSGRDEHFVCYTTSTYKLHLFETATGYKFVMFSDPNTDSLRFILRQLYSGPFLEYVVRNPLNTMDSRERGIDNEYFRASVDRLVRGLSVFQ